MKSNPLYLRLSLFSILALPVVSHAQSQEEEESLRLSQFVVTSSSDRGYSATHAIGATRTNAAIKDIPQTVLVINQAFLEDAMPGEQYEALKYLSGISISSNVGDQVALRGYDVGSTPYTDGLPDAQNQTQAGAEPFMYERLEVFKGPSAIVYGSHALGGVVNRVRKIADLSKKTGGNVGVLFGNHGQKSASLDYNARLKDNFAYRVVGIWRDEDLTNGVPTRFAFFNRYNFNPSIAWRITPKVQLKLVGEFMSEEQFKHWSDALALQPFGKNGPTTFKLLPRDFTISDSSGRNENQKYGYFSSLEMELSDRWSLRLLSSVFKWDHEVNDWVPNGISADNRTMVRRHRMTINDDFRVSNALDTVFGFDVAGTQHQVIAIAQLNRARDEEKWIQDVNLIPIDIYEPNYSQSAFINPRVDRLLTNRNSQFSLSSQDNIKAFSGRLQLVGGVRYDSYTTQSDNRLTGVDGKNNRGHQTTYKGGVILEVYRDLNVYYNYSETFTPVFGTQPDGTSFNNRDGVINEIGVKTSLNEGRINGTVSFFKMELTNILANDPDPVRASQGWRVESDYNRVEGVELDLSFNLTSQWELMVSASKLSVDQPNGLAPRGIPERTAAFWTRYAFPTGRLQGLAIGGGVNWIDKKPLETGNNYWAEAVATADVFANYTWRQYRFALNISNLTDEWYLQRAVNSAIMFQGPRRLIKASVRYQF